MKSKIIRIPLAFLLGFVLYPCIELIARGRTHPSMAIVGGLAVVSIVLIDGSLRRGLFLQKALLSAIVITQLEWISGVILNLYLKLSVWDYSNEAFHLAGQICPRFSFYWFLLSLCLIVLLDLGKSLGERRKSLKAGH